MYGFHYSNFLPLKQHIIHFFTFLYISSFLFLFFYLCNIQQYTAYNIMYKTSDIVSLNRLLVYIWRAFLCIIYFTQTCIIINILCTTTIKIKIKKLKYHLTLRRYFCLFINLLILSTSSFHRPISIFFSYFPYFTFYH